MSSPSLPLPLAKAALTLAPPMLVAKSTAIVLQRIRRRHPKLFKDLARLPSALALLEPTDTPHSFALTVGEPVTFTLVEDKGTLKPDAVISGSVESLIAMLEGKEDGDTLFFSRDIKVTGDTTVIVGLRNTLDREEIDLMAEILSLFGPFAKPMERVVTFFNNFSMPEIKKKMGFPLARE